jgi:hypothetical protein
LVEINQIVTGFVDRDEGPVQINALQGPAALEPTSIAGAVYEYSPHCLGCRSEKVRPAVPMLARIAPNKPQIRLVHQGRRLKRVSWRFTLKAMVCKATQILVNEREQMLGRLRITALDGRREPACFTHGNHLPRI